MMLALMGYSNKKTTELPRSLQMLYKSGGHWILDQFCHIPTPFYMCFILRIMHLCNGIL